MKEKETNATTPIPLLQSPAAQPQRLKMIEAALKAKAPQTYRQLKKDKTLRQFLEDQEAQMMESYDLELDLIRLKPLTKDYLADVQKITMDKTRAWEETLATYLDFSDPETTDDQTIFELSGIILRDKIKSTNHV